MFCAPGSQRALNLRLRSRCSRISSEDALGRVPEPEDSFNIGAVLFKVVEVADHRIRRVLVDLQGAAPVRTAS
jgi:Transporter associated domain